MAETYELKAKLVFSDTAKDAEAAMKPIKDYFDRHPVKLPFGVDEAATAAQMGIARANHARRAAGLASSCG